MESLFELVAASLARHGIDCPDAASERRAECPASSGPDARARSNAQKPSAGPNLLREHSFRQKSESDLTP